MRRTIPMQTVLGNPSPTIPLRLGGLGVESDVARQMTLALENPRHASPQRAQQFFDIRVLERRRSMESWRESS